jgi:hypothetical protein
VAYDSSNTLHVEVGIGSHLKEKWRLKWYYWWDKSW